jgi:alkanesulfonate monooxygenase SsuD/methylene tetrahydromethanopterin reductase-like flavin-dependent oxidoreductase (luciferase family)
MRIGIGVPNTVPGTNGPLMLEWARRAEERGFAFVSTIGRVAYPSYDSLTALAAVAGATSRIGLQTNAVLGPAYADAVLAKTAMTVAQLSGDRLTLGLGVGARESDYAAAERDFAGRGAAFDRQLEYLHRAWRGEPVAQGDFDGETRPVAPPGGGIPILIGGHGERAVRRTARWAAGWTGAGGGPARSEPMIGRIRTAWREAGRTGEPRLAGLAYFGTEDRLADESDAYLRRYYAYAGDHAATIAEGAVRTPGRIQGIIEEFAGIGMNELVFTPTLASIDEVDRLADLVL